MGYTLTKHEFAHPGEIFQRILASLGIDKSVEDVKKAFLNAENEAKEIDLFSSFGRMEREEYWLRWDALVLKHLGITENAKLARASSISSSSMQSSQISMPSVKSCHSS